MKSGIKAAKNVRCKKTNYFKRNLEIMGTQLNFNKWRNSDSLKNIDCRICFFLHEKMLHEYIW